jgi:hypothetical protein
MSRSLSEKVVFVSGYLEAMNLVTSTLTAFLDTLEPPKMAAEKLGGILPDLLREGMKKFWDFSEIQLPEVVAFTQAVYSEPENARVPFHEVFPIARDLYLHRITDEDARQELAELRSEGKEARGQEER